MIDMREAYDVGALLYSPALNMNIATYDSVIVVSDTRQLQRGA